MPWLPGAGSIITAGRWFQRVLENFLSEPSGQIFELFIQMKSQQKR
jgi:hypothetical protein